MKRLLVLLMLVALLAGLFVIAGCGDDKKTVETPFGDVTIEEEDGEFSIDGGEGEVTFETDEGDVSYEYSDEVPSEKDLGAPIYPDAEYVPGSGGVVSGSSEGEEFTTAGAEFTTDDSFDDVVDFYTDEIGEPFFMEETTKEATWMVEPSAQEIVTVTVTDEDGEVLIYIGRMGGSE